MRDHESFREETLLLPPGITRDPLGRPRPRRTQAEPFIPRTPPLAHPRPSLARRTALMATSGAEYAWRHWLGRRRRGDIILPPGITRDPFGRPRPPRLPPWVLALRVPWWGYPLGALASLVVVGIVSGLVATPLALLIVVLRQQAWGIPLTIAVCLSLAGGLWWLERRDTKRFSGAPGVNP